MDSSTRSRLDRYGVSRLAKSPDFIFALVISVSFTIITSIYFTQQGRLSFVQSSTRTAQTLIAVILTGIIILVSISDDDFILKLLKEKQYEPIMFTFEYTTGLAIFTAVVGSIVQSYQFGNVSFFIFNLLFFYTVSASLNIVSKIVTFGKKRAQIMAVGEIDDDIGDDGVIIGPDEKKRESVGGEVIESNQEEE